MGPPGQLFFPSCLLSSEDSRRIHTVKYKSSSLLIKKNLFRTLLCFFHKIKRTYQTHIFLSFNNEICYLNYDTKHFFFFLQTPKTRFSTIFFKPQFSHLFKQQFLNFMTKRALTFWVWPSNILDFQCIELDMKMTHVKHVFYFHIISHLVQRINIEWKPCHFSL